MDKAFKEAFDKVLPETEQLLKDFLSAGCAMNDSLGVKHTQGKWEINNQQELTGDFVISTDNDLKIIATAHKTNQMEDSTFRHEAEANAHLIAAAPDLLDFVQSWSGHNDDCDCLDEGSPRTDCTCGYEKAREQAIKKATT